MEDGYQQRCLVLANRHLTHTLLQRLKDIAIEEIENIYERCLATTLVTDQTTWRKSTQVIVETHVLRLMKNHK